jgi:hypothetical protein
VHPITYTQSLTIRPWNSSTQEILNFEPERRLLLAEHFSIPAVKTADRADGAAARSRVKFGPASGRPKAHYFFGSGSTPGSLLGGTMFFSRM